ncbi:MAG: PilC/PilY family type IV pilus protein [Aquabacterium sp.]
MRHTRPLADSRPSKAQAGTRLRQSTIVATLVAMQAHWIAPAHADMYQLPLLSTSQAAALPNFVLTLDNSESMALNHLPESSVVVNGVTVAFPGTRIVQMYPLPGGETDSTRSYLQNPVGTVPGSTGSTCASAFECQMRSPDVNSIYYNPGTLYQPWPLASDPGSRMPNAAFDKAPFDPLDASKGTANLSAVSNGQTATWCTGMPEGVLQCAQAALPFNPAVFYRIKDSASNPGLAGSYVQYNLNGNSTLPWGKNTYPSRKDCDTTCTLAQERQNFANWFTYYRSRILLTKGAVSEAFASVGNNFRLGWGFTSDARSTNNANLAGGDTQTGLGWPTQGVKLFSQSHQRAFLNAIQKQKVGGSTPLRFATAGVGNYFTRTDSWSPWRITPGEGESAGNPILGCRRGGHILTTDGYYNDGPGDLAGDFTTSALRVGEVDSNPDLTINGRKYTPSAPYADARNTNSLADIAMRYWAFPLVPGAELSNTTDKVKPTDRDPADWLHLNQYMVGLGVKGSMDSYEAPPSSTVWPAIPGQQNNTDPSKIDDMGHAAVNSRGRYFTAKDGESLRSAIISSINDNPPQVRNESGVGTVGTTAIQGDTVYIPRYNATDWSGDVSAAVIDSSTAPRLQITELWTASSAMPAPDARKIYAYSTRDSSYEADRLTPKISVVAFTSSNKDHFDTIPNAYRSDSLIEFLRGGNPAGTGYRNRERPLPDFVNSTPLLVSGNLNMQYDRTGLPSGGASYKAFVESKAYRTPLLFLGGNGGMLHAFDASKDKTQGGGREVFAYVPKGVQAHLHLLAQLDYRHRFYVDGPLAEADAYIDGNWKNYVIGTLGAGGKGVFAIEVPPAGGKDSPALPSLSAASVKWDLSNVDVSELGHITSPIEVGPVQGTNDWYAFVGNGHDSTGGTAALIVVDLATGKVARKFVLANAPDATTPNGLSGVSLIRNAQGEVIGAYAGDLHGQIWRFEFAGNDASQWRVGFGSKPLFRARLGSQIQKISAAPAIYALQPQVGTGHLILFGTGRLTESGDTQDTSVQTFYGVLDPTDGSQSPSTSPFEGATSHRSLLQQQSFLDLPTNGVSRQLQSLTSNAVVLSGEGRKLGWYLDLDMSPANTPGLSQVEHPKVIYKPTVVRKLVYFTAVVAPTARESCSAQEGGQQRLVLPVLTGGQADVQTWDTDGDGFITTKDEMGQGYWTSGNGGESRVRDTENVNIGVGVDPNGLKRFNKCAGDNSLCPDDEEGGLRPISDRIWKRIVKPPF